MTTVAQYRETMEHMDDWVLKLVIMDAQNQIDGEKLFIDNPENLIAAANQLLEERSNASDDSF